MLIYSFLIGDSEKDGKDQVLSQVLKYCVISKNASEYDRWKETTYNESVSPSNELHIKEALEYAKVNGYTNIREVKHYKKVFWNVFRRCIDTKTIREKTVPFAGRI